MIQQVVRISSGVCGLCLVAGCSMFNTYFGGEKKQAQEQSYVQVWLDNEQAKAGDVRCKVAQPIGVSPTLKFEITEPEKMGRVSNIIINIFREFEDGWSSNADFIVTAADINSPDAQMKPGVVYDFGAPNKDLRIMDGNGQTLEVLKLAPGTKYLMNFVVSADRSETVQVEFKTR